MNLLNTNKRRLLTATLFILTIGFIGLSCLVYIFPPSLIDLEVSLEIQEHHNLTLDHFMTFISWFGTMPVSVIMVGLIALIFFLTKYKREAVFTLFTLSSGVLSTITKALINRSRPTKDLVRIIEITRQQSFPSGHTMFYTVFFGFLIIVMDNLKYLNYHLRIGVTVLSAVMILMVPFSRIYLGAHWFTDVLGGVILGLLSLFVIGYYYLFGKGSKRSASTLHK